MPDLPPVEDPWAPHGEPSGAIEMVDISQQLERTVEGNPPARAPALCYAGIVDLPVY